MYCLHAISLSVISALGSAVDTILSGRHMGERAE